MLVAGFDTETTGLDVTKEHIIEVGAVLWDTERRAPVLLYSALVHGAHLTEPLPPKITELTGITDQDLETYGVLPQEAFENVLHIFKRAEAIVAHNGNLFDKPIWEANLARHGFMPSYREFQPLWVDTSCDIEFPNDIKTRKLKHLAAEHGFLNPFAHRAQFDVLTMLKVCDAYDWEKIVASARTPNLVVRAVMPFTKDEMFKTKVAEFGKMKDAVKSHGFRFDNDTKDWVKSIKEFNKEAAKKEAADAGYKLALVRKEEVNV